MSVIESNNMNKRKNAYNHYLYNTNLLQSKNKDEINYKIKSDYINNTNNNNISLRNNHIYFNSIIDEDSIKTLILFINNVIANKNLFDIQIFRNFYLKAYLLQIFHSHLLKGSLIMQILIYFFSFE